MSIALTNYYFIGGTVPTDAPSYVHRKADDDLLDGLKRGQFCYVLMSRQMGKSSLLVRTMQRLRNDRVHCAMLDLTGIGQNLTSEQWYDGLLHMIGWQFDLEDELETFWEGQERLAPLLRFTMALRDVVLKRMPGPVVLFVDEVDAVRNLPFSADEFFAGIRECYNRRTNEPEFSRLTFALFGVASPSDLIRDIRTTPFNIGRRIELTDFTAEEATPLAAGLGVGSGKVLARVLYWTGGHPYLTQRLCQAVAEAQQAPGGQGMPAERLVDRLCEDLFLSRGAQEHDDNLIFVRNRLLNSEADVAHLLDLYRRARSGRYVLDDESNPLTSVLKLSGVVRADGGRLRPRNRIYTLVFDRAWVTANMPDAELRRQKEAYRKGVMRATAVAGLLLLTMTGLVLWALSEADTARQEQGQLRKNLIERNLLFNRQRDLTESAIREKNRADSANELAQKQSREAQKQKNTALQEKDHAVRAEKRAVTAERRALKNLSDSYSALAQARRYSGRPGQKIVSLALLKEAAHQENSPERLLHLRNEAIACLALPIDVEPEPVGHWNAFGVDMAHERIFESDASGAVHIRRMRDRREIMWLPGPVPVSHLLYARIWRCSGDGHYVNIAYTYQDQGMSMVWDIWKRRSILRIENAWYNVDFSPDGRSMAYSDKRSGLWVKDLAAKGKAKLFPTGHLVGVLRFCFDGHKLAFGNDTTSGGGILDLRSGAIRVIQSTSKIGRLAWHPDGRYLAGGSDGGEAMVWDAETGSVAREIQGASGMYGKDIAYNHRGDVLATLSSSKLHLWDPTSGEQLLACPTAANADSVEFSADDRLLAVCSADVREVWVLKVKTSQAYRSLYNHKDVGFWETAFSPDGRTLAAGGERVNLWDTAAGVQIGTLPTNGVQSVFFTPDGAGLMTFGLSGLQLWPIRRESMVNEQAIGPPLLLDDISASYAFCLSQDGKMAAINNNQHLRLVSLEADAAPVASGLQYGMSYVAISPDRRWVATGSWQGEGVKVWKTSHPQRGRDLPDLPYRANVMFDPSGRWLVTGTAREYRFWRVGSWKPGRSIARPAGAGSAGVIAFTPDGDLMAVALTSTQIALIDPRTGRRIAELEAPSPQDISNLGFSRNGVRLIATGFNKKRMDLWDLGALHHQLAALGLDWKRSFLTSEPSGSSQNRAITLPSASRERKPGLAAPLQRDGARMSAETGKRADPSGRQVTPPAPLTVTVVSEDAAGSGNFLATLSAWIVRYPGAPGLRLQRAQLYLKRNQRKLAIDDLCAALRLDANDAELYDTMAWAYVGVPAKMSAPEQALPFALRATRMAPENPDFFYTLALVYYRLGQMDHASEALREDVSKPDSVEADIEDFLYALIYQRQGHPDQARTAYEKALHWRRTGPAEPVQLSDEFLTALRQEAETALGLSHTPVAAAPNSK